MALHSQLLRRGGQQQDPRHALGQLFNRLIFTARRLFAPHQVVRLIDDHQVPFGIAQVLKALLAAANKIQRADNQLLGFKRVVGIVLRFGIALVVKQREAQVEAAQHFDQPLVLQGFRNDDQHALGGAGKQLLMQDHPGFDGFTEPDFIRQQHARGVATANVVGDVQLVRDQAGALAAQAAPRHPILLALIFTRAVAQRKAVHTVDLPGEQAILRLAENQLAVEQHFTQDHVGFFGIQTGTGIGQQAVLFIYFVNLELPAFVAGDGVARIKHHAGDRGVVACVQTIFADGGEKKGNHARIQRYDRP
ncbi:hypothetical protein D3C80_48180 [compost metagenome]